MFTGLITHIGTIASVVPCLPPPSSNAQEQNAHTVGERDLRVRINADLKPTALALGDSICCSGVCLTVTDLQTLGDQLQFEVVVSAATLSCTTLGGWKEGEKVNLEPSLVIGQQMGGHYVSGHVDAVGTIVDIRPKDASYLLRVEIPSRFNKYLAPKGSITIHGVSLTINAVHQNIIDINLIPHTWSHTTFSTLTRGMQVNVEIDTIARYIVNYLEQSKLTPLL